MLYLAIILMCMAAIIGLACAINYFLRFGPWPALGYASFAVCIFLLFAASGIWEDAPRHNWGALTPVFALMLVGGFICLKFGGKGWAWWRKKEKEYKDKDDAWF